jgi:hypothetical protein
LRLGIASSLVAAGATLVSVPAVARITQIVVTTHESPTFGGYSWPGVGQYEKIAGKAFGELNPNDPHNTVIVDLPLGVPKAANGNIQYSFDFYILKPINLAQGNHKMLYEPPNRGGKTISALNRGVGGNDPGSVTNPTLLQNAFLMPRGYSISFSGWDLAAGTSTANFNTTITLPIAKNPDGTSITGPAFEYIVSPGATYTLTYPAANPADQASATLTHRIHLDDPPVVVPASGWSYVTQNGVPGAAITVPGGFTANDVYEFSYTARDPQITGVGYAAVRDWNAWLRYSTQDDFGNPNPLAGDITRIYTEISSQPGRMLNDFRYFGFNQSEGNQIVFDGLMQWIAAGDGISMNYRWAQPGRTERNRQDHLFNEGRFPFANMTTTDPITNTTDSRYARCTATNTCPHAVEIYSANEYWVKAASLMTTDPTGSADLPGDPGGPFTRIYFMSSMQHGTGNATSKGACQQFGNPLDSSPVQRALFIALDQWVTQGTAPPPSQVPKLSDGTLTSPATTGFPSIPGVTYTGLKTTRYLLNYGPNFRATGIPAFNPPLNGAGNGPFGPQYEDNPLNGPIYPSYVPKVDADGNDIAGIRLPRVSVPLATYTGWGLRSGAWANDGCESTGQFIPFTKTLAQRMSTQPVDPRPSAQERYGNVNNYYTQVTAAVKKMVMSRTLLLEDIGLVINDAMNLGNSMLPPN